jgi:surface protein
MLVLNRNILTIGGNRLEGGPLTPPVPPIDPYNPLGLPPNTVRVRTSDGNVPVKASDTSYESATLVTGTSDTYDIYKSGTDFTKFLNKSSNVVEILGANTTGITNMYMMLRECSFTSVPLFDTSSVTNMYGMLYGCSSLITVPLFDTSNVTDINYMFGDCTSLTSVPLFDTSNLNIMSYAFKGCSSLTSIPLFNTNKVTHVPEMFMGCVNVQSGALAFYQQLSSQTNPPTYHTRTFTNCGSNTQTGAAELAQIPSSWGGTGG